jgi:hypothetical protein
MRSWIAIPCLFLAGTAFANDYVGADRCGTCHEAEYKQWKRSGHATALARLSRVQQEDATCRTCHTMVPASDDPELAGVQCESCHGAGRFYEPSYVMRDKVLAELNGLQKIESSVCTPCHTKDAPTVEPFEFAAKVELVRHEKPEEQPAKKEEKK